jgi:hypothetical protein
VNVLNASKGFLPEFQLISDIQLSESSFEMTLQSVGLIQINGMHLRRVFGSILNVIAEELAQSAKFGLAGVFETKVEGLMSSRLIKNFQASIILEYLENCSISLPQEFKPWSYNGSISSVFGLLSRYGSKKNGLGGFRGLEIFNIADSGSRGSVKGRLDLFGFRLGFLNFLFGKFDKFLQNELERG